ncbi:hypothetical protein Tco_0374779, partial [Tanacetum coccineum]
VGEELEGLGLEFSNSFVGELGDIGGKRVACLIRVLGLMTFGVGNRIGDRWKWMLGEDGEFKTKELSRLIEMKILHRESARLSVHVELDRRGIDLDLVLYPSSNNSVESCAHSLVTCDLAISVWEKIFSWWKLGTVNAFTIDEFFSSYGNVNIPDDVYSTWHACFLSAMVTRSGGSVYLLQYLLIRLQVLKFAMLMFVLAANVGFVLFEWAAVKAFCICCYACHVYQEVSKWTFNWKGRKEKGFKAIKDPGVTNPGS